MFVSMLLLLALSAGPAGSPNGAAAPNKRGWSERLEVTGTIDGVEAKHGLLVYLPKGYTAGRKYPLVLALHGWKHSAEMFRDEGTLDEQADRFGVVVAVPDMGTTIYETLFYAETRAKKAWSKVPGTRWVGEVILPYVREHYAVYADRQHTGVIGYSTGGRGALLLAEIYPEFGFAGSTSGTFDLMRLKPTEGEYRIHEVVYGSRETFPGRWDLDNVIAPARLEKLFGVRVYASHGTKDRSVNPDQLSALEEALKDKPGLVARFERVKGAAHEWPFWNTQWAPMFEAMHEVFEAPPR